MSAVLSTYRVSEVREGARDLLALLLGSLLLAFSGQCLFFLWFTPVPVTLQTAVVMWLAATLGAKRATMAVLLYLVEGLVGLPFFSAASFGIGALVGPQGGYLLGFLLSAFFMGYLLERPRSAAARAGIFSLGALLILLCGVARLAVFVGGKAWLLGFFPFLLGEGSKAITLAYLYRWLPREKLQ